MYSVQNTHCLFSHGIVLPCLLDVRFGLANKLSRRYLCCCWTEVLKDFATRAAGFQSEESVGQSSSHPRPTQELWAPARPCNMACTLRNLSLDTYKAVFLRTLSLRVYLLNLVVFVRKKKQNYFAPTFFLFKDFKFSLSKFNTSYDSTQHRSLCAKFQGTETFYKKLG